MSLIFYWDHFIDLKKLDNKKLPNREFLWMKVARITLNEQAAYRSRYQSIHSPSLQRGT
ncbi:hypothetical protein MITS9508_01277 [Synechococcus sp. MIT S9508]|nr:hypothetical protein MITS9508_01277 [Synechococcus sp. MIT S9508]